MAKSSRAGAASAATQGPLTLEAFKDRLNEIGGRASREIDALVREAEAAGLQPALRTDASNWLRMADGICQLGVELNDWAGGLPWAERYKRRAGSCIRRVRVALGYRMH